MRHSTLKLLRDPDTTFEHFKALRLVCKTFDAVWSPVVLFRLSISRRRDCFFQQLHHLMQGESLLPHCRALTLRNWGHVHGGPFSFVCRHSIIMFYFVIMSFFGVLTLILYHSRVTNKQVTQLLFYLLVLPPSLGLFALVVLSIKDLIHDFTLSVRCFKARRYATQLPQKIQLPHAYSVQ